jgi:hypothetical protein
VKDSDSDESDGSRSTKESSRSSNSHSSRRNQQIAAAANYLAQQQVASNTAANANIRYQEQQRANTLSERIGKKQHAMQAAIRKQRNVNAIIDTGAQVTTMAESAANQMPAAHNHRNALPVKNGNGEIKTPDNCSTSSISVDQIVADRHTVAFSATETIITDDNDRYRLTYPRVPNSQEWTVPMQAMEDLSRLRQDHPLRCN